MPLLVRKISPEVIFCFLAYFCNLRHSLPGNRMVRILPFSAMSARPAWIAYAVMYLTSDTRMPVAQIVSISKDNRAFPKLFALSSNRMYSSFVSSFSVPRNSFLWIFRYFIRHSGHLINLKNLFSAESFELIVSDL